MDTVTPGNEPATLALAVPDHDVMPVEATEDQMLAHLWRHFAAQSWAPIPQVTVAMRDLGVTLGAREDDTDRRIDMLIARKARNPEKYGPLETMAIEVKVTRADFQSDVRNPAKQAPWRSAASRHAYAVPAGLVAAAECPPGSGLLWVTPPTFKGGVADVQWVVRPPSIPGHKPALPFRVLQTLMWRVARHEAVTRGWTEPTPGERTSEDLRAELVAARTARDKAEKALTKAQQTAESWRKAYALSGQHVACAHCGKPVKPLRPKDGGFSSWRHLDAADLEPCALSQLREAEEKARDAYNDASDVERDRELRRVHRYGFDADVEADPWRAFLAYGWSKPLEAATIVPALDLPTGEAVPHTA